MTCLWGKKLIKPKHKWKNHDNNLVGTKHFLLQKCIWNSKWKVLNKQTERKRKATVYDKSNVLKHRTLNHLVEKLIFKCISYASPDHLFRNYVMLHLDLINGVDWVLISSPLSIRQLELNYLVIEWDGNNPEMYSIGKWTSACEFKISEGKWLLRVVNLKSYTYRWEWESLELVNLLSKC